MISLKAGVKTFANILQQFFQFSSKQSKLSFAGGGGDLLQIKSNLEKWHNWRCWGALDFIIIIVFVIVIDGDDVVYDDDCYDKDDDIDMKWQGGGIVNKAAVTRETCMSQSHTGGSCLR